ncbi:MULTISPECIES: hypothetical protein [unclassified Microbulbifer]|uniref:hypothetical protein n=1 Tax=unclassified Microbulbifer TaxID=2619833 RepID=UPI0027E5AC01|nr:MULTISPECIES: hypothetical protein [unclassified Microbulbifer]
MVRNMFSRALAFLVIFFSFALFACGAQRNLELGEETWYQVDSANFRIITNGDPEAVKILASDLERYRAVALTLMPGSKAGQKLTIYAAADRQTYGSLVGAELGELTNGLYDTTAQGSYALVNLDGRSGERQLAAREFLFHEYTHFLSYNRTTIHYPYWYSEGFAEFMSTMDFPAKGHYEIGGIPEERAMTLLYTEPLPLEQLLRATVQNIPDEEKSRVYASGWMLAHWVIMESGKAEEFKEYVKAYNNGADPVESLERALGMTLAEIDREYKRLFQEGKFDLASGVVPTDFREVNPRVHRLLPQRAMAEVGRFLVLSGYNLGELYSLVQYARAKNIASPELTAVQAEAEIRLGNFDRAERLLATIPVSERNKFWYQSADAWLGVNREMFKPGPARDRQRLEKARDKFKFLVNNESDNASHWYGLAMAMEMLDYPREKYTQMLEQAYLRAPRQVEISQWLAMELYEQKDAEYFAQVAQPLLLELTNEDEYQQMKMMLAELKPKAGAKKAVQ